MPARIQGVGGLVCLVKGLAEAAENGRHRQVKLAVAKDSVGVDQGGRPVGGEHEVARPEVAVQQRRRDRPLLTVGDKLGGHPFEVGVAPVVPPARRDGCRYFRLQTLMEVEVGPGGVKGVVLDQGLGVVVFKEAKLVVVHLVESGDGLAEVGLRPVAFV